jgi:hypothetical protein
MLSDRELLSAVQGASDDFIVYGELGRQGDALAALLARERASGRLVVLMVTSATNAAGELELSIEVKTELDARIPDGGTKCPACGNTLRPWVRFCTRCGHDVTGRGAQSDAERAELRVAVIAAVEGTHEFLGSIRRSEGGGDVFFAQERDSGRIAALRLNRSGTDGEYELGETNILRKAPERTAPERTAPERGASDPRAAARPVVSVTQLLRKLEPDDPPLMQRPVADLLARADMRPAAPSYGEGVGRGVASEAPPPRPAAPPVSPPTMPPAAPAAPAGMPPVNRTMLLAGGVIVVLLVVLAVLVFR